MIFKHCEHFGCVHMRYTLLSDKTNHSDPVYKPVRIHQILNIINDNNKKLILSGTPMPQGSMDLVGQFKFLYPSVSGVNEDTVVDYFQDRFVRTTKAQMGLPEPIRKVIKLPMKPAQKELYQMTRDELLALLGWQSEVGAKCHFV